MEYSVLSNFRWLKNVDKAFLKKLKTTYYFGDQAFMITEDDDCFSIGKNNRGMLGIGSDKPHHVLTPRKIESLCQNRITNFSCGRFHVVAFTEDGKLYTWGRNGYGQLGLGHKDDSFSPAVVEGSLSGKNIIQAACGTYHTLVLTSDGEVFATGSNSYGQLGIDSTTPQASFVQIKNGIVTFKIFQISCGNWHSAVVSNAGEIFLWGDNSDGQVGTENTNKQLVPHKLNFPHPIKKVTLGYSHTLALTTNGILYAWGSNGFGQLGLKSDSECLTEPIQICKELGVITDILAFDRCSCCKTDTNAYVWGICNGNRQVTPKTSRFTDILKAALDVEVVNHYQPIIIAKNKLHVNLGRGISNASSHDATFVAEDSQNSTAKLTQHRLASRIVGPQLDEPIKTQKTSVPLPVENKAKGVWKAHPFSTTSDHINLREIARCFYPYPAGNEDELTLNEGDIITIISQNCEDEGWWRGEKNGKSGLFPNSFVKIIPASEALNHSKMSTTPSQSHTTKISPQDSLQKQNTDPDNYAYTPPLIRRELPQPEETASIYCTKVLSSFVPLCAPVFVGREDILTRIERQFETVLKYETYTPYRKVSSIVIHGLPGMGKSELAKHYLHTIVSKQTAHCIWLEADTDESFLKSLESALLKFSLNSPIKKGNADFLAIITNLFESVKDFPFVFCFDNLDNLYVDNAKISKAYSFVCALLTHIKSFPDARVQLIITTRCYLRGPLINEPTQIKLNALSTENSIELLDRSVSCKLSVNSLRKISHSLLNLPLLVQNTIKLLNQGKANLSALSEKSDFEKKLIKKVFKISKMEIINIFESLFKIIGSQLRGKRAIEAFFILKNIHFSDRFMLFPAFLLYMSEIGPHTSEKLYDLNSQSIEDFLIREIQWLVDFSICCVSKKPFSKLKNLKFIQINTVIEFILNEWDFHAFTSKDLETQINECKTLIQSVNLKSQLPLTSQIVQNYCLSGYTVQNINFVLDNLAPIFTGRNSEVAQIEDFLKNENDNVFVVYGSQGIGKTELIKFIFNNSNDFLFKFWLDISTKNMHCITKFYYDKIFLVFNDIFNNFEDVLEVASQYSVLLVIDHAPHFNDTDQLTQLLDIYQRIPNLRLVYITRQNPKLMMGFHMQLDALTENDSKSLVRKSITSKKSTNLILKLCSLAENHPLVLTEALKTINNKFGGNIEKYLKLHQSELENLPLYENQALVDPCSDVTDSQISISHTLTQQIIYMLSYFDPSALVDIDFIAAILKSQSPSQTISNEEVLEELKFVSTFHSLCTINEFATHIELNKKAQVNCRTDLSALSDSAELTFLKTLISSFKILLNSPSFKPVNIFHLVNVWNHFCCYDEQDVYEVDTFEAIREAAVKLKCTLKVVNEKTRKLKLIDFPS